MAFVMCLHGVPDTPAMWQPLIKALGLTETGYSAPALPGFTTPPPAGFSCTKDAYVDWYISEMEAAVAQHGPVHLVGHDWGALITVRAASLRPDLVASWCASNALPHPDYRWHRMARMWQTPLVGEFVMAMAKAEKLAPALVAQGIPADLAKEETRHWGPDMKRAILKLYRSAKTAGTDWYPALQDLPERGLIFWGVDDPYVPVWVAEKVAADTGAKLSLQAETGHWSIVQRADALASELKALWG